MSGNDVEKQEEVVRENESLGTVMEAMLPKSLGASDSDIQGVIVFMVNSEEMNAGQRPGPQGGGPGLRPAFISEEFTMKTITLRMSESEVGGNIITGKM